MTGLKTTSQSLIISFIIHGIILLVLTGYLVTQNSRFQDLINATILKTPEPPKPKVRKLRIKPVVKPAVRPQSTMVVEQVRPQPRTTTAVDLREAHVPTEDVIEFSNHPIKLEARPQLHRPKVVNPNQPIPHIVTHVDLPTSDAPGTLAFAAPTPSAGAGLARSAGRGISSVGQEVQFTNVPETPGIQSLLDTTLATPNALDSLVGEIRIGNKLVIPMRSDELGARIYTDPQTGMPTGYFQFCYVRFRQRGMNDLFRVDPTALSHLVRWMSARTRIRGRIAGRTLFLDDSRILESPMLYMNGTRAAHLRDVEKVNLTRYLVDKGGFIFVDDDRLGGSLASKTFAHTLRAEFREIIRGAGGQELSRIPNEHPIWNQPFNLGGQPAEPNGTGRTWPMTAFELNGRLSVVFSYNDYNNGWEEPGGPRSGSNAALPSVLRMGANFIFYAATHGKISDYRHYVPPDRWRKEDIPLPKRAPQAARISATGFDD